MVCLTFGGLVLLMFLLLDVGFLWLGKLGTGAVFFCWLIDLGVLIWMSLLLLWCLGCMGLLIDSVLPVRFLYVWGLLVS